VIVAAIRTGLPERYQQLTLKIKSLKERTEPGDGLRILIARYRPRALPKHKENWDEWYKDLASSKRLHKDYMKDRIIDWPEYKRRFLIEIVNSSEALEKIQELRLLSKNKDITLLCHCHNVGDHCHRYLIKDMIQSPTEAA
jgi:uncharacterized protein YeaO (DUF488 family)